MSGDRRRCKFFGPPANNLSLKILLLLCKIVLRAHILLLARCKGPPGGCLEFVTFRWSLGLTCRPVSPLLTPVLITLSMQLPLCSEFGCPSGRCWLSERVELLVLPPSDPGVKSDSSLIAC